MQLLSISCLRSRLSASSFIEMTENVPKISYFDDGLNRFDFFQFEKIA